MTSMGCQVHIKMSITMRVCDGFYGAFMGRQVHITMSITMRMCDGHGVPSTHNNEYYNEGICG